MRDGSVMPFRSACLRTSSISPFKRVTAVLCASLSSSFGLLSVSETNAWTYSSSITFARPRPLWPLRLRNTLCDPSVRRLYSPAMDRSASPISNLIVLIKASSSRSSSAASLCDLFLELFAMFLRAVITDSGSPDTRPIVSTSAVLTCLATVDCA